jgi:dTDP-4-amino-4,6-dideoxygalactose transaminase
MEMQIPNWPISTEREIELLREVLASGRWGGHSDLVKRLEREFADFTHCAHAISAMNGTVTLEMALTAAAVGPGDEVIVPAISFVSTAMAVSRVGALPVFVDIEQLSFNMDPARAAAAITPRTKAIIPVHFGGAMADMDRLAPLAAEHGLALIEDAAHAHGSEWAGRRAGSLGLAGSFSFQNSKVMTAGEGGMLTTNDADLCGTGVVHYGSGPASRKAAGSIITHSAATIASRACRRPCCWRRWSGCRSRSAGARATRRCCGRLLADVLGPCVSSRAASSRMQTHGICCWAALTRRRMGRTRDEFHRALTAQGVPCTPFYPHPLYGNPLYRDGRLPRGAMPGRRRLPLATRSGCRIARCWATRIPRGRSQVPY